MSERFDTIVIGAGQAGLSAGYHLARRRKPFVILDAAHRVGGAWQHRWDSLTMDDVHGVAALPDSEPPVRTGERAHLAVGRSRGSDCGCGRGRSRPPPSWRPAR